MIGKMKSILLVNFCGTVSIKEALRGLFLVLNGAVGKWHALSLQPSLL